ncbi:MULTISPECIES: hypothetical protein [Bradyrhizobium]|uniref:Uncharacterized protein n=1 Tax=Bradyrhizobium septentrionale TaxID=1404411 RepID=A0ABZ2NZQ1_9BRAD|nr:MULTISPECIES: hypothetical protein [unclassified Bradyrhizobium]QIG96470.1 hypothetical protein G6P99_31415 [Bradyrhizobium sp. 6(2017)]
MTELFSCWSGTYGILCAEETTHSASANTVGLTICIVYVTESSADDFTIGFEHL